MPPIMELKTPGAEEQATDAILYSKNHSEASIVEQHVFERSVESPKGVALQSLQKWTIVGGMMLGIYVTGLDSTMLATIIPTITDYFGTIHDISWYETAYVLAVCAFMPLVGRIYSLFSYKYTYICFVVVFELGSIICAVSISSPMLVAGRAINGIGSAGLLSGAILIITAVCEPKIQPIVTAVALSLISVGSITGPLIAGGLAARVSWRWCFWIFLPLGGVVAVITFIIPIPEGTIKPRWREAITGLHKKLDPIGFTLFSGATTTFILGITWGGSKLEWSSVTIIGLLCGSGGLTIAFVLWSVKTGEDALILLHYFHRQSIGVGSAVIFLQAGVTQMIPYFLPFWFQSIKGDSPVTSSVHMLASLISQIAGLIAFGALVQKLRYVPPWAIVGSILSGIGSWLLTRLSVSTSVGTWVGYQIITTVGRGMAFQVPISLVQRDTPSEEGPIALAIINLFMSLGLAVGVSAGQTIFSSGLPRLLEQYAPGVDAESVLNIGATGFPTLVQPNQLPGLVTAYNLAITNMFYLPAASSALACLVSVGLPWKRTVL